MIATVNAGADRNAIGAHGGSYSIYRALAISSGAMDPKARPDLQDTSPVCEIGPHTQWGDAGKIVSLDPWGHRVAQDFGDLIAEGIDIRPSIAITKARLTLPEIQDAIAAGRLEVDGEIVHEAGDVSVTKIADRSGLVAARRRRAVRGRRSGPAPLPVRADRRHVSRAGHPARPQRLPAADRRHDALHLRRPGLLGDKRKTLTCRVHDECNGSDVFGSDICTCRPYLTHGIEEATRAGAGRRRRPDRLQPQGRPRARRGDQVPRLQRPQAPAGRRPGGDLFRAHRMRRRRPGRALPAAHAGRDPLARHPPHRPLRLDVQHEI